MPETDPFPNYSFYNQQALALLAQIEYQKMRMNLIDLPMLQLQKDQLAMQAAIQAVTQALQKDQLGLQAMGQATGQASNEALGVANLVSGLRGPRNSFKQAEVMYGLGEQGLPRSVEALAGKYVPPRFMAPSGKPEAANLTTLVEDMRQLGGIPVQKAPSEEMMDFSRGLAGRLTGGGYGRESENLLMNLGRQYGPTGENFTENQALDAIWGNRPDLEKFYQANGWKTNTTEERRAAVRNWMGMTDDRDVMTAGRNAINFVKAKRWPVQGATQSPDANVQGIQPPVLGTGPTSRGPAVTA